MHRCPSPNLHSPRSLVPRQPCSHVLQQRQQQQQRGEAHIARATLDDPQLRDLVWKLDREVSHQHAAWRASAGFWRLHAI